LPWNIILKIQNKLKISNFGSDLNGSKLMATGRPGPGRPRKADEERVRDLSLKAIISHYGSEEAGFKSLLESKEPSLVKFVFEHAYGKPRDKVDLDLDGKFTGPAVILQMPAGTTIALPDNTEEPDNLEDEGSPSIQE
jgi:hypothetical protein